MVHFDQAAKQPDPGDDPATIRRNARLGMVLFALYSAVYLLYVLLAALATTFLAETKLGGVNLAVWFGFGLIALAIVLALFYAWLCRASASTRQEAPR